MNERIQELAVQSGFYYNHLDASGLIKPTAWCDVEKFAELIVRECCDLVREIDAMEIRKHFGVE